MRTLVLGRSTRPRLMRTLVLGRSTRPRLIRTLVLGRSTRPGSSMRSLLDQGASRRAQSRSGRANSRSFFSFPFFPIFSFSHFTLTIKSGSQSLHSAVPAIIGRAISKYFFKMLNNSSPTYRQKVPYL